ncbi:phosphoribosylanthranilate isomerase [Flavobacterium sp. '19STA2R22 D10 B1']|uniref:phosphoribosylanthranilate isomerase n=1 Tax=Flavobacterium aerium TaxID=3037261 RepID=UPI00278BD2D0|nr:phosphoribosylanthranilate isomerase [Flavobacterium sp. '19STA2R22 D10 B1']
MKLKVCGMKYPENIIDVAKLHPDYMGFIFWEKSARYFNGIIPDLPESIEKVGVFVDATFREIVSKVRKYQLDIVQLHGNEQPELCKELKQLFENIKIIKVFSIGEDFDFNRLVPYETSCDYYLFDTKGELPGGNGLPFNWQILERYPYSKPFFLSGGVGIEEHPKIKELIETGLPIHSIDINSKFELEPGLKYIDAIKRFKYEIDFL